MCASLLAGAEERLLFADDTSMYSLIDVMSSLPGSGREIRLNWRDRDDGSLPSLVMSTNVTAAMV